MIAITQEKKRKYTHIGRKEVELSLYADYKILHIEYPIDYIRTLLKRISKLNEVAGYKVNIQNSVAYLHTNNEISQRESQKKNHFKNHIKKVNGILRNKPDQRGERLLC